MLLQTCSYLFLSLSVVGTTLRKISVWAGTLTGKANQVMTTSIGRGFLTINKHTTLATLAENPAYVLTAVAPSKTFNIPGLNLSSLIVPDAKHRATITQIFNRMHVSASNPFSIVAFEAAYREGETWLDELLAYLRDTRDYVENYLAAHLPEIRLINPEGTYLLWLDCRALGMSDAQLKHFFVHEVGVGLSPGILFGEGGSGFMRMNIGAPRHTIVAALENIRKAGCEAWR
jgi:cystathionine beta-lyase